MSRTSPAFQAEIVPWRVVGWLSAGSIPAALLTLAALHGIGPANRQVQSQMTHSLGVALLLTAAAMFYKTLRGKQLPAALSTRLRALPASAQSTFLLKRSPQSP